MRCPKCGTESEAGAWLCARCETILDPSFLGDDILNEATRSGAARESTVVSVITAPAVKVDSSTQAAPAERPTEVPQGESGGWDDPSAWDDPNHLDFGDSVILGRLGDAPAQSVLSNRTGQFLPVKLESKRSAAPVASVFIGDDVAQLLLPDSVPVRAHDADARKSALSPFEAEVLALVDGNTSIEAIRARGGLSDNDVRVAMAMLLDKAMIEIAGPPPPPLDDADLPFDTDDHTREIGDLDVQERLDLPNVDSVLEDHTRELPAIELDGGPPPVPLASDELHPVAETTAPLPAPPLPAPPQPPAPHAPPPRPPLAPAREPIDAADAHAPAPALRPAMRVDPVVGAARRKRPSDIVERGGGGSGARPPSPAPPAIPSLPGARGAPHVVTSAAAAAAPAPSGRPRAPVRAAELYELCMKDLHAGRVGRAWGYAKMALDADPDDERLKSLLADWNKIVAQQTGGGPRPMTPQELLAASQKAEQEGDIEAAVQHMKKLCEMAKGSGAAWNRLGVLLATRQREFRAGYDAVMKAVELEPGNLTYQSNMMKILAKVDTAERKPGDDKKGGLLGRVLKR